MNRSANGVSYVYGTEASFACNSGFGLMSLENRTCTENGDKKGFFNGSNPSCKRKSPPNIYIHHLPIIYYTCAAITCGALTAVMNRRITYSVTTNNRYAHSTTATYMCDTGYNITGQYHTRTCEGDGRSPIGTWSGEAPECPRKP